MTREIPPQYTRIFNSILGAGEIIILWMVIFAQVFSFNRFIGNELDVLAFARQFFDRSWLPNDWYLNLDIGYRQVFNYLLGFAIDRYGFLNGAYIGRITGYLVLAIALFIFFRSISLRFFLGLIVVILFLENQSLVAGEWIVGGADTKTFAYAFALLHGAGNGILTIAKGTLPLALFGAAGYGRRLGWLNAPARILQAAAPLVFGAALTAWGLSAIWLTAGIGLAAFFALLMLRRS